MNNGNKFLSCKTSFKRVAAISAMSVAAFMGAAMYGLPMLPGRALTEGETSLLQTRFKHSIDYNDVKISNSPLVELIAIDGFGAFTIGNTMFYTDHNYSDDFSKSGMRDTFIHEGAHVWQNQNCQTGGPFGAMWNSVRARFNLSPEENYEYRLEEGKDLTAFHAEHQASIVADYDRLSRKLYPIGLQGAFRYSQKELGTFYQATLQNFLNDPSYPRKDCWNPFK